MREADLGLLTRFTLDQQFLPFGDGNGLVAQGLRRGNMLGRRVRAVVGHICTPGVKTNCHFIPAWSFIY